MSGELTADERLVDEKKLFEVEVYKVVYNNALAKLSNRYVYENISFVNFLLL